jgi:hypothetical protein
MTHSNLSNTIFISQQNEVSIFIPYLPSELFDDDMPDIKETLIKLMNSIGLFNIKRVDISKRKNCIMMAFIHFHYWENTDEVICIRNLMDIQGYYHVDLKIAFKPIKKYVRLLYNKNSIPDIEPELNIVQLAAIIDSTEKRINELQKNDIIQKETIKRLSEDLNDQKSHYITEFNDQTTRLYESNDKNELLENKIVDLNNMVKIKDEANKDLVIQLFNKSVEIDTLKLYSEYKTTWNHSLNSTTVNYIESLREINKGYYIEIANLKEGIKNENELKKIIMEKEAYIIETETAYRSALKKYVSNNTILSNKCDALKSTLNYELKHKNELNTQHANTFDCIFNSLNYKVCDSEQYIYGRGKI